MQHKLTFTLEKETPGALRYKEDAEPGAAVIGQLYVRKSGVQGKPQRITVTMEY